ncbi:MAG: hypothetical protein HYZ28_17375 [Myxococcales bacterium]|nr:hypothetical protein [Myxococcales bacterium]
MRSGVPLLVFLVLGLAGCPKRGALGPADAGAVDRRPAEEACVDGWLAKRRLDPYGSPEGTAYMGGTPLFDERTQETTDRLEYVYRRHPEAKQACER